jgi:hypothetical protein
MTTTFTTNMSWADIVDIDECISRNAKIIITNIKNIKTTRCIIQNWILNYIRSTEYKRSYQLVEAWKQFGAKKPKKHEEDQYDLSMIIGKSKNPTPKQPIRFTKKPKVNTPSISTTPKPNTKANPKANTKANPKANQKTTPKANQKTTPKANPKANPQANPQANQKANQKAKSKKHYTIHRYSNACRPNVSN